MAFCLQEKYSQEATLFGFSRMGSRADRARHGQSTSAAGTGFKSLVKDQRGSVAIIFGVTVSAVVAMTGGAVDLGRAYIAKSRLQSAVDGAALAGASTYVREGRNKEAALARLNSFFNSYADLPGATLSFNLDEASGALDVTASMDVHMPFLGVVTINTMTIKASAKATASEGVGTNGTFDDIEISIMLDTTGSMGDTDANGVKKIDAMKTAATELIDMLVDSGGSGKVKVGLAPFAPTVELETSMLQVVTNKPLTKDVTTSTTREVCDRRCVDWNRSRTRCKEYEEYNCRTVTETTTDTHHLYRCVTERTGTQQFTDASPGSGAYIPTKTVKLNDGTTTEYATTLELAQSCTPDRAVVPLTADKTVLKSAIASFKDDGPTAGWLGTTWAWYLLSPNWGTVFGSGSAAKPYGTAKLKKIAILMTDGEYNTAGGVSASSTTVNSNARTTCANMKAQGIEIYTVGFMLDTAMARETFRQCATSAEHNFSAANGNQLKDAFRAIAYKAVPLHLSQ
jgi:Flp pilus assembly protein TadG